MLYTHSIKTALQTGIGAGGIADDILGTVLLRAEEELTALRSAHEKNTLPLLRLPEQTGDLAALAAVAKPLAQADDVVFLGTGGSSLGGQALVQLAGHGVPGLGLLYSKPRIHFLDNLDPVTLDAFLRRLSLKTAKFVAISKAGGTSETLMQAMAVIGALKAAGLGGTLSGQLVGLSEPARAGKRNGLRTLLEQHGCPLLDHDPGIGGRYSALSNVGLLPALVAGLNIEAIRAGAALTLGRVIEGHPAVDVPPALGAALSIAASAGGKTIHVLMAYADRFERFSKWWVQLWGESLGKQGLGSTPVAALGPVDQHSQLQLWLDGPRDKLFTILTTGTAGLGPRMDAELARTAGEPDFAGRTVGDLVAAQGRATADTLSRNGVPVRTIHIEQINERSLGALMMHFMLETILTARLLGVDPFDQPAVEAGKVLAKQYLQG